MKYRIFDGEEMIILDNSGLQYFDFEGSYSLGFTVDAYSGFWAHEQYENQTKKSDKFPIMQYIGIKDKNDEFIFEGDFVESGNGRLFEIRYGKYQYHNDSPALGFYMYSKHGNLPLGFDNQNIEVIGNIYENPELLK